jgi:hypothetical protein
MIRIPVSIGEVFDKISILEIKMEKIDSLEKKNNIKKELNLLNKKIINYNVQNEFKNLKKVNLKLWQVEDNIRKKEKDKIFDNEFVELARSVYFLNDKRAKIKRKINQITNSNLCEEKQYVKY